MMGSVMMTDVMIHHPYIFYASHYLREVNEYGHQPDTRDQREYKQRQQLQHNSDNNNVQLQLDPQQQKNSRQLYALRFDLITVSHFTTM